MKDAPPEEKATPAVAFCFAINHLLRAEPWARARLVDFEGEAVAITAAPLPALLVTIEPGGLLSAGGSAPSLTIHLTPRILAGLARGEEHALRGVEVSGNARLATEVMQLARSLRWDFEEDLARLVGDVAAHRVAEAARAFAAWHADAAARLAAAAADYATEESRLLVRRAELDAHAGALQALRDAIERLDKRMARLA
ncbi:MAG TPA: SCP2 sterol-binding domain-containing protein [Burkholderiales bacterium]|nr:SCP2 sterol-binding domain-containing protein [Burkholderiales bacterium]